MRHGQSTANVEGIVLSGAEDGKKREYTLTGFGEEQVYKSIKKLKENGKLDENIIIISSPFSRAIRTAEIVKEVLGVSGNIVVDELLCERWFGDWDKTDNSAYEKVWTKDKDDPSHKSSNVESASEVQNRIMQVIKCLDNEYSNKTLLLVSHGDTLQILLTSMQSKSPAQHREIKHLETSEIREVIRA